MSEQEKQTKVIQSYEQPVEIDLSRSAKGQYYWKIQVKAVSPLSALRMVQDIDAELRHRFAEGTGLEPGNPKPQVLESEDAYRRMEKAIENVKKAAEKGPFRSE